MSETNGHVTTEAFRDRANRLRTIASLDNWWREYDSKLPPDATKAREKGQKFYIRRRAELEASKTNEAKTVLNRDDRLKLNCSVVVLACAVLSMFLNALANYVSLEAYLRGEVANLSVFLVIGRDILQTGDFYGVPLLKITRCAAVLFGVMIPPLVLGFFSVASKAWHRYAKQVEAPSFWKWLQQQSKLSFFVGSAGIFLLLLSLTHCRDGLMLFGMPSTLALLMAIAVDYGLVCVEIAKIRAHADK
jgi:hypothetical protein